MQRISDGLKVPKIQIDKFIGEATTAFGIITLSLSYTPKNIGLIVVDVGWKLGTSFPRFYYKNSLTGRSLELSAMEITYAKTDTPTGDTTPTQGGGAAHSHVLSFTTTGIGSRVNGAENQDTITVTYEVG